MQIDGRDGLDLVVGSKSNGASVGWLQSPKDPRQIAEWKYHPLATAGWIMSIETIDLDEDGDLDILTSDRFGERAGVGWLENPGAAAAASDAPWKNHAIGGKNMTAMFLTVADLNRDGVDDILFATRSGRILYFERHGRASENWTRHRIANPFGVKWGKAVAALDVNRDGKLDLIHTANLHQSPAAPAATWIELGDLNATEIEATYHDLGGPQGFKFDRIEMIDLDADGDLDLLTCEEHDNLGVIWYENPAAKELSP
jgi:hypothetical protein